MIKVRKSCYRMKGRNLAALFFYMNRLAHLLRTVATVTARRRYSIGDGRRYDHAHFRHPKADGDAFDRRHWLAGMVGRFDR